jgi:hypothetical protein
VTASEGTADNGADFTAKSVTVSWNDGETGVREVRIPITPDDDPEENETIIMTLSDNTSGLIIGPNPVTLTIIDNDDVPAPPELPIVSFGKPKSKGKENAGTASVLVKLSAVSDAPINVDYQIAGGTAAGGGIDYTLADGTLTFNPGEITKPIDIAISEDLLDEYAETILLAISNPLNAVLGTNGMHTRKITDNDLPPTIEFLQLNSEGNEDSTPVQIQVRLSAPSGKPVEVHYGLMRGLTAAPDDFSFPDDHISFNPGETDQVLVIDIVNDATTEGNETILLKLKQPINVGLGVIRRHTYTILQNDA